MKEWLTYPEVQSAVVPFGVAMVLVYLLRPTGVWRSLGVLAGLGIAVYLIAGFQFTPLNSTRKILMIATAAAGVGLVFELFSWRKGLAILLAAAGASAAVWVLWPLLIRENGGLLWWQGAVGALYVAAISYSAELIRHRGGSASIVASAFALGTGGAAILGATSLYGQLALAAGAASGAPALLSLFGVVIVMARVVTYPAMVLCGLLGMGAVAYSTLPYYCLLPLLAIPWVAALPRRQAFSDRTHHIIVALLAGSLAVSAIALAWKSVGPPPF